MAQVQAWPLMLFADRAAHQAPCFSPTYRRGTAIAPTPQVGHHRWSPPASQVDARGLAPLDAATRARLRALHRHPPAPGPGPSRGVLAVVLLLHGLFALAVWLAMRPPAPEPSVPGAVGQALQVRLIPRLAVPPPVNAPPPLRANPPPSAALAVRSPAPERPTRDAMTVRVPSPTAGATPAPKLFDRDGQPLLPAGTASAAAPAPDYVARLPQGDAQVMRHDDPIKYRSTRFEPYFPSTHETLLGQSVRGVLRATHTGDSRSVDLPGGVHLKCKTLLGIPTPMCQNPPAAPPKKDGDERLSMAPAQPLAKDVHGPSPPSEAQCIVLYRDGQPLPWGCPVDTPRLAVDAECVARYRAGKSLAGYCDPAATARAAGALPPAGSTRPPR